MENSQPFWKAVWHNVDKLDTQSLGPSKASPGWLEQTKDHTSPSGICTRVFTAASALRADDHRQLSLCRGVDGQSVKGMHDKSTTPPLKKQGTGCVCSDMNRP